NINKGLPYILPYYLDDDGILCMEEKEKDGRKHGVIVAPTKMRAFILWNCHYAAYAGHAKVEATLKRIRSTFQWHGMKHDVIDYIKHCERCQERRKPGGKKAPFKRMPPIGLPFERASVDIVGPLVKSESGHQYLLTYMD